jgi:hypothetical protein
MKKIFSNTMGSLIQLQITDGQDKALMTPRPDHSMFVQKYARYHHFATEHRTVTCIRHKNDDRMVVKVPRAADLLSAVVLTATVTKTPDIQDEWMYPLEGAIDRIELHIGGIVIEEFSGVFCRIYDEIYRNQMKRLSYATMGNFHHNDPNGTTKQIYMPLPFPCCTPLPLIGLPYAEVEVIIHLRPDRKVEFEKIGVDCEYIYCLPNDRIQWMEPTELQIKQVQHRSFSLKPSMFVSNTAHTFHIDEFNHPVYKIIVAATHKDRHGAFTGSGLPFEDAEAYAPILKMRLLLNGQETTPWRYGSHHRQLNIFSEKLLPSAGVYIFDIGFSQGQGTVNFSKLHSAVLQIVFKQNVEETTTDDQEGIGLHNLTDLHVFALNYNWVKIADGQGGVIFSS